MRSGRLALAAVVGLALPGTAGAADPAPKEKQFQTDLRLLRGDPLGSQEAGTVECLSQPMIRAVERQEGRVFVGQRVTVDGKRLDVGCSFRVVAEPAAAGKVRLRVTVEVAEVVENPADRRPTVRTVVERTTFAREARPGETLRVRVGKPSKKETWLELRAREVKE